MEEGNQTRVVYFHFQPFLTNMTLASLEFMGFLLPYVGSLAGNLSIALTVWQDHSLHTPMYFFLFVLAVLELGYSTNIAPLVLASILSMGKMIMSLPVGDRLEPRVILQLIWSDCVLFAVMAYDTYVAICHPLHYNLIVTWQVCREMTLVSLGLGCLLSLEIYHFFCDIPAVMCLVCTDMHIEQAAVFITVAAVAIPLLLICLSCSCIVATILRMKSYGCCTLIYLRPSSSYSPEEGWAVSVVYTFFSPLLIPLIYSIRNQEANDAVKRLMARTFWFWKLETFLPRK
uniref:Olfactory receptor family 10 subfamily Q member 3 n=1 Tax=Nannospalax galili TaxID=1026970 RepID=A0A8C6RTR7_NANGA